MLEGCFTALEIRPGKVTHKYPCKWFLYSGIGSHFTHTQCDVPYVSTTQHRTAAIDWHDGIIWTLSNSGPLPGLELKRQIFGAGWENVGALEAARTN